MGIAFSSGGNFAERPELKAAAVPGVLRTRKLGRTGLDVTELSFGGIELGESPLLHEVIDRGINLVHTCGGYANGKSIIAFGEVLKTKRQKVFIALKASPKSKALKYLVKRLNTDYADILVPPAQDVDAISDPELPEAFERCKKQGLIRFSGFACHKNEPEVVKKAVELGYFDVMLVKYNLENKDELDPVLALAKEKQNMGFMAMKVTKSLARRRQNQEIPGALRTIIGNKNVDTMLVGMLSFEELEANLAVLTT